MEGAKRGLGGSKACLLCCCDKNQAWVKAPTVHCQFHTSAFQASAFHLKTCSISGPLDSSTAYQVDLKEPFLMILISILTS